jgi:enolase
MPKISKLIAREILDSRGNPTVEVDLYCEDFMVRASVPSGASTGSHEVLELRDGNKRFNGLGVQKAVKNINTVIAAKLNNQDVSDQKFIDLTLSQLDGTDNKSKLGANALLAVSMAACRAGAKTRDVPLYKYIQEISGTEKPIVPVPYLNVINGGRHAGNALDIQEYMIVPKASTFRECLRIGSEVYHALKKIIRDKYGLNAVNVGDEGGFAPPLTDNEEPLRLLMSAISKAGYKSKVKIALDCAASEFFYDGFYILGRKGQKPSKKCEIKGNRLAQYYLRLIKKYHIISIEDGFAEDDWASWADFCKKTRLQVVGDDLLVTNTERMKTAIDKEACNALLLKVNQIGTVSEAIEAAKMAYSNGWNVIVSHRSGETEDTFIADLAVGLGCGKIKSGAPCRTERVAKYNQLLRIEEEL